MSESGCGSFATTPIRSRGSTLTLKVGSEGKLHQLLGLGYTSCMQKALLSSSFRVVNKVVSSVKCASRMGVSDVFQNQNIRRAHNLRKLNVARYNI